MQGPLFSIIRCPYWLGLNHPVERFAYLVFLEIEAESSRLDNVPRATVERALVGHGVVDSIHDAKRVVDRLVEQKALLEYPREKTIVLAAPRDTFKKGTR